MTKEELLTHVKTELKDELEGILKYNDLYEGTDCAHERHVFEAIASDEWAHAHALRDILSKHGETISPECAALWEKVEKIID